MIKKTLWILIAVLMLNSLCFFAFALDNTAENLMFFPKNFDGNMEKKVTKAELAYTISKILGSENTEPCTTEFSDVDKDNLYSGYIDFACSNGYFNNDSEKFNPDMNINFDILNDSIVKLIGYGKKAEVYGGGNNGNFKVVTENGIYNGVEIFSYDYVTVLQFKKIISNLVVLKLTDFEYSVDGNGNVNMKDSGNTKTLLSENFKISVYKGTILAINNKKGCAEVVINSNVSKFNPDILTVGEKYTFFASATTDLNKFENVPAEIWTDKDKKIINIKPLNNVEVVYDAIYSVNNDILRKEYLIDYVNKIEFLNSTKKYKVDRNCKLKYNGRYTDDAVVFKDKFVKVVAVDGKVNFIEMWSMKSGGLITATENNAFTYYKTNGKAKFDSLNEYNKLIIIVDGLSTDASQIKPESVFSYYKDGKDELIICVSERKIAGTLEGVSDDKLIIS